MNNKGYFIFLEGFICFVLIILFCLFFVFGFFGSGSFGFEKEIKQYKIVSGYRLIELMTFKEMNLDINEAVSKICENSCYRVFVDETIVYENRDIENSADKFIVHGHYIDDELKIFEVRVEIK